MAKEIEEKDKMLEENKSVIEEKDKMLEELKEQLKAYQK
jgi:hypothetical protein